MNQIVLALGLETWKPFLTQLLLPPVPLLVLMLAGAALLRRRRLAGRTLLALGAAALYLSSTGFGGWWTARLLLDPPYAVDPQELTRIAREASSVKTAVVVLGGGLDPYAPEYDMDDLSVLGLQRLRYGVWLSRTTGLPLAFSGGLSPGVEPGGSEADIATRIAAKEFRHPLRWTEGRSRDTRENAAFTVALLRQQGVARILLVTHQLHMPRALRNFRRASAAAGVSLEVVPAPVGVSPHQPAWRPLDFFPSTGGIAEARYAMREWLGLLAGA